MGTNFNKIIVVGSFDSFNQGTNGRGIARLNVDGAIDNTFNAGQLSTPTSIRGVSGGNATIQSCYVIPDGFANAGKILIGGIFTNYNGYPANNIALLNANGTYDTTSGFNVKVNTILDNTNPQAMPGFNSAPTVFEVQSNGQIVVAGYFTMYNGLNRVGLVRLNADGTFDTTFNSAYTGANPLFSTVGLPNSGNTIKTMVLQPDGKIIIGGYFSFYNNVSRNNIVRINSDGSLDTTFNVGTGFNNTVIHPVTGTNGLVRKLVLDTTSDLAKWFVYVSGDFTTYQNSTCDEIIRIICKSSNTATIGNKDNNFIMAGNGTNGTVWSMKPQNDGKIIIGGQFTTYGGLPSLNVTRILPSNTLITFEAKNSVVYYDSEPEIDQFNQSELILYPNPSKGMFNFNANYFEGEDVCVQVYNQLGQKVFERIYVHTNDASFDLSEMAKGIFFVTFTSKSKSQTRVIELN